MDIVGREGSLHKVNRESLVHSLFELYKLHKVFSSNMLTPQW